MLLALSFALAASPETPGINAQRFRPSIDAEHTIWTDDSTVGQPGRFSGRLLLSYTRDPLVYLYDDGGVDAILANVAQLDLLAGYTVGPVRAGLVVPIILRSFGGTSEDVTEMGDVAFEVKGGILRRQPGRPGLAAYGRVGLPTGLADGLASDAFTAELGAVVDHDIGPVRLQGAAGALLLPEYGFENVLWGPQLSLRGGGGVAISPRFGLALEVDASTALGGGSPDATTPAEVMLGGWTRLGRGTVLRAAVGTGLNSALGAPALRAMVGVGFEPRARHDGDGDEVWDDEDRCPGEPEDADHWEDEDGCAEGTLVKLRFVDRATGEPVAGVMSGFAGRELAGDREHALARDSYPLQATAPGYVTVRMLIDVPPGRPAERIIQMEREALQARLQLKLVDEAGLPVAAAVTIPGQSFDRPTASVDRLVAAGTMEISAQAPGYGPVRMPINVQVGQENVFTLTLRPARAAVVADRIEIREAVYFETGRDLIKPESFSLLDEVATILKERPELLRLRIEGHTDSKGSADANLSLSRARAESVRQYLITRGVEAGRLEAEGFGESRPLSAAENEAAWSKNRRVEFVVVERR